MIKLNAVDVPSFEVPLKRPAIPASTYAARCDDTVRRSGTDWVVVYADREHSANMIHLTGFEPRFEEAVLLLGKAGERILLTGNESLSYAAISPLADLTVVLAQSMSLMGQDRSKAPNLARVLAAAGVGRGNTVGIVGWKYHEPAEWDDAVPGFVVPHNLVAVLARLAGGYDALSDVTDLLMHPTEGSRSVIDADQIAVFEWAAARASSALWRAITRAQPGESELEAASRFGYAGEPLSCHTMFTSASAPGDVIGLSSPSSRQMRKGDGVSAAIGYWGGLSSRAGLLTDRDDAFADIAKGYFAGLLSWYDAVSIGVSGGAVFEVVTNRLAETGLSSALNPGHLISYDEWSTTPIRPGSDHRLKSGMLFQVDVIPTPMPAGAALNCEDTALIADAALRQTLAEKHPQVMARITQRQAFLRDQLGVTLNDKILPLSNIQLCLPPCWLSPQMMFTVS